MLSGAMERVSASTLLAVDNIPDHHATIIIKPNLH